KILKIKTEDILNLRIKLHNGQSAWRARKLFIYLFKMVVVDVYIAKCVYILPDLQAANLSHHHLKQCVAGDIEGNTKKHIGTALIKLQRQLTVGHIKLEKRVAGRQRHIGDFGNIPG